MGRSWDILMCAVPESVNHMILTTIFALLVTSAFGPGQGAPFASIFPDKRAPLVVSVKGERKKVRYDVPSFARVKSTDFDAKAGSLRIQLRGALPKSHFGYMSVEAYFEVGKAQKRYFAAMPLGSAAYKPSGEAWAFEPSWRPAQKLSSNVETDWIEFRDLTKLIGGQKLYMVVIRYLPNSIDPQRVSGQTSGIVAETWMQRSKLRNGGFFTPSGPPLQAL